MKAAAAGEIGQLGPVAEHIARAAARLFAAQGYDATPVRTIVEAAGVTKPTLYYYFGSKEGLAQALLTRPMTRLVAAHREILESAGECERKLVEILEVTFAFCREDPDRARFVYALFFGPLGSSLTAELGRFGAELTDLIGAAVSQAAAAGVVAPERAQACAVALRGLITISTMDYLYRGCDLSPGLAERLVADLLGGFGPPDEAPGAPRSTSRPRSRSKPQSKSRPRPAGSRARAQSRKDMIL